MCIFTFQSMFRSHSYLYYVSLLFTKANTNEFALLFSFSVLFWITYSNIFRQTILFFNENRISQYKNDFHFHLFQCIASFVSFSILRSSLFRLLFVGVVVPSIYDFHFDSNENAIQTKRLFFISFPRFLHTRIASNIFKFEYFVRFCLFIFHCRQSILYRIINNLIQKHSK